MAAAPSKRAEQLLPLSQHTTNRNQKKRRAAKHWGQANVSIEEGKRQILPFQDGGAPAGRGKGALNFQWCPFSWPGWLEHRNPLHDKSSTYALTWYPLWYTWVIHHREEMRFKKKEFRCQLLATRKQWWDSSVFHSPVWKCRTFPHKMIH